MTAPTIARTLPQPDPELVQGIRRASRQSGIDFGYLMAQAAQESGFRADARARTSSATGLYQFIDGTWLDLVRRHGAAHGVPQDASRAELLALREDPRLSAAMAAEYARENKAILEKALDRRAGRGELALAHFLGPGGATQFLRALEENAATRAAHLLPAAATANPAVFFDRSGNARSIGEIWRDFSQRIEREAAAWTDTSLAAVQTSTGAGSASRRQRNVEQSPLVRAAISAPRLSRPTLAMLDALAFAALRLLGQEERR